jgi:hypothetical protein
MAKFLDINGLIHLWGQAIDKFAPASMGGRVTMLEAIIFNDISTNPFLVLFEDLDGVTTTGVWNQTLRRIEC